MLTVLVLAGCPASTSMVEGRVEDIWGNPVQGATVMVVGGTERPLTDATGHYAFPRVEGNHLVKAGRKGFVQDHSELEVGAGSSAPGPTFKLYPKPEEPGLYLVAEGHYDRLTPVRVRSVGNKLRTYRGIETVGDSLAERATPEVVFHTDLRGDEIHRLGLTLHHLEYVRTGMVPGTMGDTEVAVNQYVDIGEIAIDLQPLRSKTDYRITPKAPLEPGVYAFQTQDLLSSDNPAFDEIPEELRVVFPFEVR